MNDKVLEVSSLTKIFQKNREDFTAVDNVSFTVSAGECVGLIGESGSGKSTIANMVSGLLRPTEGDISFLDRSLTDKAGRRKRELRKEMQMVFQDPTMSFSPKMRLITSVEEGLRYYTDIPKQERKARAMEALEQVGLKQEYAKRKCWELSGGECQRAAIARAILIRPKLLICDEVTSALDVSVQAQIIRLLYRLKEELGMSYLFISHDLALVSSVCDRILVLYQGQIVESGTAQDIIEHAVHPYTRVLLESVFLVDREAMSNRKIVTVMEAADRQESSCRYASKCRHWCSGCSGEGFLDVSETHSVRCTLAEDIKGKNGRTAPVL